MHAKRRERITLAKARNQTLAHYITSHHILAAFRTTNKQTNHQKKEKETENAKSYAKGNCDDFFVYDHVTS